MRRAALVLAALTLAGCGATRTRPPQVEHAVAPQGTITKTFGDVTYHGPRNWQPLFPAGSLIGGLVSNTATVAIWRYPRTEPLPEDDAALESAQTLLVDRARQRNPTFTLREAEVTKVAGAPAIELTGSQSVAGFGYDVRSTHLFANGAEIVVDAYAPTADFARVDREVFQPFTRSLEVKPQ